MRAHLAALVLAGVVSSVLAEAGQAPPVVLAAPDPSRWDFAGSAGGLNIQRPVTAPPGDDWSTVASAGGSLGYYWTPHLKVELGLWATTRGRFRVLEPIPGQPPGTFRAGTRHVRADHLTGSVVYQFFENTWFHPYAGAGIDAAHESERLEILYPPACVTFPCVAVPQVTETSTSQRIRPFAATGFKWYVSERAFIRSEVRGLFSRRRISAVQWVAGVGADF